MVKVDNEQKQAFIIKLSIETPLSYTDSQYLIKYIDDNGNLDTAEDIYTNDGIEALIQYKTILGAGF